jgi:hypothetical protein
MGLPSLDDHDEVMRHHHAAWRVERVGWALMAAMLAAALAGLFGDGPLSRAHAGSAQSLRVEYDRLVRSSAPTEYRFFVHPAMATQGELHLRFDRSLVEHMELDSIIPEPERQVAGSGHTDFVFRMEPGAGPLRIDLRYRPATFGRQRGEVSVVGRDALRIEQFAFP